MKPMKELNKKQQSDHDNAKYCHICKKVFSKKHYHYTGDYRNAAHSICNLRHST